MRKTLLIPILILCACKPQPSAEDMGQKMLQEARTAYAQGDYAAARDTILSLRKRYPTAFEARRQAILLMDSVELMDAQGDTLKTEFYQRKLKFDTEKIKE